LTIGSPAGFVSVLDPRLPILFDELGNDGSEEAGDSVKAFDQTPGMGLELFAEPSQRHPVQVIHHRCIGHELVPIEVFGEHSRGTGLKDSSTLGAVPFGKPIEERFSPKRVTLHYEPLGVAFIHECGAALRTEVPDGRNHRGSSLSLDLVWTGTSSSKVSRTRSFGFTPFFHWLIGFERNLRRGR